MFSGTPPPGARTSRRVASSRRLSRAPSAALQPSAPASPAESQIGRSILAPSAHGSPAPSVAGSVFGGRSRAKSIGGGSFVMDVDGDRKEDDGERVLVKDAAYQVTQKKNLPEDVKQIVTVSDGYTDPFRAELDSLTGYAYLISTNYCFVWNWARPPPGAAPTAYIFELPKTQHSLDPSLSALSPLSFASLVPSPRSPSTHEPGLLVLTPTGALRHWSAVSQALSGARPSSSQAPLLESELVRALQPLSATSYLAPTSAGRLLVISLEATGTKGVEIIARVAERPTGWGGAVWSAVFGTGKGAADPRGGVIALALGAAGGAERLGYVLTEKEVQVWRFPVQGTGGERVVVEHDLLGALLQGVTGSDAKSTNEEWALNAPRLEVVDAVVAPSGYLAVLVSYVANNTVAGALSYAIVQLEIGATQGHVNVAAVKHLAFQAVPDPRPLSSPKLSIPSGETAFVMFVDAVLMVNLAPDLEFEEAFSLRSSTHRFFGLSTPAPTPTSTAASASQLVTVSLLSSTPSILTATVNPAAAPRAAPKTRRLQTRLEQAVFFGGAKSDNPLAFDLRPGWEGDLGAAAEAVSQEICASSAQSMPFILDLRSQLADRVGRARALIEFVNSNGLLGKLSQSSRRQLSWDAERLTAAVALWQHQNTRFGGTGASTLLATSVMSFMTEAGEGSGEDPLRTFFRTKVQSIGAVIQHVTAEARRLQGGALGEDWSAVLHEANTIVLLVFSAVARFRTENASLYGINPEFLSAEPWTGRAPLLEGLQWHFEASEALLTERVRTLGAGAAAGGAGLDEELKAQMAGLAEFTFSAFEERLLFLTTAHTDKHSSSPEARALTASYHALRPRFLHSLVGANRIAEAYSLAEQHRDFPSLVALCTDPKHGNPARIRRFLDVYQAEYADALFQHYLERGQLRKLLEPEEKDVGLLTAWLDKTGNRRISWVNDWKIGRWDRATEGLVGEALTEQSLAQKKLMLSLGKLSQVAQATHQTLDSPEVQKAIEGVDDALDLVNTQREVETQLRAFLSATELRQPTDKQAEIIAARAAPSLAGQPAFALLFTTLVGRLLSGTSLSPEDLVDVLTLKVNGEAQESEGDFAAALEVLVRAKAVPEARREIALQSVWRRVYLADDWSALRAATSLSDDALADALRRTALYATRAAATELPDEYVLDLGQLAYEDVREELSARFPDAPAATVERLVGDYEGEARRVEALAEDEGVRGLVGEVARLVEFDRAQEGGVGQERMEE